MVYYAQDSSPGAIIPRFWSTEIYFTEQKHRCEWGCLEELIKSLKDDKQFCWLSFYKDDKLIYKIGEIGTPLIKQEN